jgi:hypothetical protein
MHVLTHMSMFCYTIFCHHACVHQHWSAVECAYNNNNIGFSYYFMAAYTCSRSDSSGSEGYAVVVLVPTGEYLNFYTITSSCRQPTVLACYA